MYPLDWALGIHQHRAEVRRSANFNARINKILGVLSQHFRSVLRHQAEQLIVAPSIGVVHDYDPRTQTLDCRLP